MEFSKSGKGVLFCQIFFMGLLRWLSTFCPAAAAAKSLQSCPTLCDPIDSSPPGSAVPGILQARAWGGLPFPSPSMVYFTAQLSSVESALRFGKSLIGSWCAVLFTCYHVCFASILWRIYVFIFMCPIHNEIGLIFLWCLCLLLVIGAYWPHDWVVKYSFPFFWVGR